ncbi:hypothetical protein AWB71_00795 [Caballeronia peredens]|nr:hypothetical protein AWB71_00795 [Caballeronia peredens]
MKFFNRLANRESLMLVAIVASAITMHVRQHVTEAQGGAAQSSQQVCEPAAANPDTSRAARAMPADCSIRAKARSTHPLATWV